MGTSRQPDILTGRAGLNVEIAQMGALAEKQLSDALLAFERRDTTLANAIRAADTRIDALHLKVEQNAVAILQNDKMDAAGLREILTAIKVASELERVGDLAKNVAKRTLVISAAPVFDVVAGVVRMGRRSLLQLSHVLDAYGSKNLAQAQAVWQGDDEIDEMYNSLFQETLKAMMADPANATACTHLAFVAKNFERVGDHATNIAESVHFLLTGDQLIGDRPKGDETATTAVSI
ncbi:MAG: phosphate signaling complex protein PhoU [Pseudomonadota bacterium]